MARFFSIPAWSRFFLLFMRASCNAGHLSKLAGGRDYALFEQISAVHDNLHSYSGRMTQRELIRVLNVG